MNTLRKACIGNIAGIIVGLPIAWGLLNWIGAGLPLDWLYCTMFGGIWCTLVLYFDLRKKYPISRISKLEDESARYKRYWQDDKSMLIKEIKKLENTIKILEREAGK